MFSLTLFILLFHTVGLFFPFVYLAGSCFNFSFLYIARCLLVTGKCIREITSSTCHGTKYRCISVDLQFRNICFYDGISLFIRFIPSTRPRRLFRSPITSPVNLSGTRICIFTIGSNRTGEAARKPSLNAIFVAVLNAISEESTG